jgi:hypothetical protein
MATRASCPAFFVSPAPRGRGQHSPLSLRIFATAILEFRFNCEVPPLTVSGEKTIEA